ncbi:MAG: TolC family protein [Chthoniobacterales bacterium]|jgi:outer membrane protein TolC|nr:TolC family protein [Chthoniobacterales bacterium]
MKRTTILFCSLLLSISVHAEPLNQLLGEVLQKNHAVAAARLNWEAMQEKPAIAGSLPDPMASYGYFFQNVETRVGAQNQRVGLSQKIPFPGKLSAQKRRASKEALMAMWQYQAAVRDAILRTKLLYCDLYRVDRSAQILREQGGLIENITRSSQQTFEAGKAELQDVLKSKVARDELRSRQLTLEQQRAGIVARINALRARPANAAFAAVQEIPQGPLPSQERLFAVAEQYRQELQQAGVAIERDELGLALARKERLPDFTFGVDYTQVNDNIFSRPPDNGHDAVVGFVSVNVPIWFEKLNAQERMARKQLDASRETAANVAFQTQAEVRDAWAQAETYLDQVALYRRSIIPQTQDTYKASESSYAAAKVGLIDLLDSERSILAARLGLVLNEAELGKALAALERAVGVDLADINQTSTRRTRAAQYEK